MLKFKSLFVCITALLLSSYSAANVVHKERSLYRNLLVEETGDLRCLKSVSYTHLTLPTKRIV